MFVSIKFRRYSLRLDALSDFRGIIPQVNEFCDERMSAKSRWAQREWQRMQEAESRLSTGWGQDRVRQSLLYRDPQVKSFSVSKGDRIYCLFVTVTKSLPPMHNILACDLIPTWPKKERQHPKAKLLQKQFFPKDILETRSSRRVLTSFVVCVWSKE